MRFRGLNYTNFLIGLLRKWVIPTVFRISEQYISPQKGDCKKLVPFLMSPFKCRNKGGNRDVLLICTHENVHIGDHLRNTDQ